MKPCVDCNRPAPIMRRAIVPLPLCYRCQVRRCYDEMRQIQAYWRRKQKPAPVDDTLSPIEVAERTGLDRTTVYRRIHAGRLKAHRCGKGFWRIKLQDLERYLDEEQRQ